MVQKSKYKIQTISYICLLITPLLTKLTDYFVKPGQTKDALTPTVIFFVNLNMVTLP